MGRALRKRGNAARQLSLFGAGVADPGVAALIHNTSSVASPVSSDRAPTGTTLPVISPAVPSRGDLVPTRPLERHASCGRVLEAIRRVRVFFPELDGCCIKVGLTRAAAGFASREEDWIWINPRQLTYHTIAHELMHLLQNHELVPHGEKSADLFALARHRTLVDDLPCYLVTPASLKRAWSSRRGEIESLLHRTARDAVTAREEGCRTYLRWFEREIATRWEPGIRTPRSQTGLQADLLH